MSNVSFNERRGFESLGGKAEVPLGNGPLRPLFSRESNRFLSRS
jgi:hypothetical protein